MCKQGEVHWGLLRGNIYYLSAKMLWQNSATMIEDSPSALNKKVIWSWLLSRVKLGHISDILSKAVCLLSLYAGHSIRTCCSSSTTFILHLGHNRSSLGIFRCLPFSIINLWTLLLILVMLRLWPYFYQLLDNFRSGSQSLLSCMQLSYFVYPQ